jgi:hypothetical protein
MSKRVANRNGPTRNKAARRAWIKRLNYRDQLRLNQEYIAKKNAYLEVVRRIEARERFSLKSISGRLKNWAAKTFGRKV